MDFHNHAVNHPVAATIATSIIAYAHTQPLLQSWEDKSLAEWPENDYRLFVGDLGNEVTDDLLSRSFSQYKSFAMAKIIRDKHTMKSKGFGFVSFIDPFDCAKVTLNQAFPSRLTRPSHSPHHRLWC